MNKASNGERQGWTSASNAQADANCPGRHLAQRGMPEEPSEWGDFGTRVHLALAIGKPEGLEVEERMVYEACLEVERRTIIKYFGHEVAGLKATPVVEKREWIGFQPPGVNVGDPPRPLLYHSGQPDRVYRRGPKALIIEFKTLAGDVPDSPENQQLRDQMVIIWNKILALNQKVEEVGVAVVQPLVTHDPVICVYKQDDFDKSMAMLFERVMRSNDPNSPRIAGSPQCDFCKARRTCSEYQKWAGGTVPQLYGSPLVDVPMAEWSPEQRAKVCEALEIIEPWIKEAKRFLKEAIRQTPDGVPGWTVNEGRVTQECTDPQKLAERFYALGGTEEQFIKCVKVGKSKLAQELSAVTGAVGVNLELAVREIYKGICTDTRTEGWLQRKKGTK